MMRTAAVIVVTALVGCVICASSGAQAATVTIDDNEAALQERDEGGWTVDLAFTNLTGGEIQLTGAPSDAADVGCTLELDPQTLPAAKHTAVTVTVPTGCQVGDDGFDFTVTPSGEKPVPTAFTITTEPKSEDTSPSWRAFWAFPILLLGLLAVAGVLLEFAPARPPAPRPREGTPLKYLKAAWTFKDSWVSNVTLAGGLLAGIFSSSDILTSLLGKEAETSVAIATVGAAVALAFTGAGAIILFATKTKDGDFFTVGGLLAGSAVTLAGAFGQIVVLYEAGRRLELSSGVNLALCGFTAVTAAVLGVYAVRSLLATLDQGLNKPKPTPASDTIVAAKMIVEALKATLPPGDRGGLEIAIQSVEDAYPTVGTSPGDDYPVQRRSAML